MWMLLVLQSWVFPAVDWLGRCMKHRGYVIGAPFAQGYWFILALIGGDYEWDANSLGLPHWQNVNPCGFCPCNKSDRNYADFRDTSYWMSHLYTLEEVLARPMAHPLFNHPDVHCNLFFVQFDAMHVLCLGVLLYMLGSVVFTLVWDSNLEGSVDER